MKPIGTTTPYRNTGAPERTNTAHCCGVNFLKVTATAGTARFFTLLGYCPLRPTRRRHHQLDTACSRHVAVQRPRLDTANTALKRCGGDQGLDHRPTTTALGVSNQHGQHWRRNVVLNFTMVDLVANTFQWEVSVIKRKIIFFLQASLLSFVTSQLGAHSDLNFPPWDPKPPSPCVELTTHARGCWGVNSMLKLPTHLLKS